MARLLMNEVAVKFRSDREGPDSPSNPLSKYEVGDEIDPNDTPIPTYQAIRTLNGYVGRDSKGIVIQSYDWDTHEWITVRLEPGEAYLLKKVL